MDTLYQYDDTTQQIKKVDFDILGNEEIHTMSSIKQGLDAHDLYDNLEPKKGGLLDTRMGPLGYSDYCDTCGFNSDYCPGHPGHIELAENVFNIGYLDYVKKILEVVCIKCSKVLINKNELIVKKLLKTTQGENRLDSIRELSKNISYCDKKNDGCGSPVFKIKKQIKKNIAEIKIIAEIEYDTRDTDNLKGDKGFQPFELTPQIIYVILSNISNMDCEIIGMNPYRSRPEDKIHKFYHIPPPVIRPSVKADFMSNGGTKEDDLTHKLSDIIKKNNDIIKKQDNIGDSKNKYIKDHVHLLQCHIAVFQNKDAVTLDKNDAKTKQFKPLVKRLKGKEGRVRKNLMGKRGDFSARTVVTGYPSCSADEVGVPVRIAKILTFQEIVTENNREILQKLVDTGPNKHPGANIVFQEIKYGKIQKYDAIDLKGRTVQLKIGDIVERHMQNGDPVLFNRQPTLQKQSLLCHRALIIDDETLMTYRLNLSATGPYNADFDGDEMNIFCPQTIQGRIELEEIADIKLQYISPAYSRSSMGITQDGLIGAFTLTHPEMLINYKDAINLMSSTHLNDFSFFSNKKENYTGKELFSLIIPEEIRIKTKYHTIKNGILTDGQLTKNILKAGTRDNLIQLIWNQYNPTKTVEFVNSCQWLVDSFNMYNGFTVGIGDIDINEKTKKEIAIYIASIQSKVDSIITTKENTPSYMDESLYESKIYMELNVIREEVSKIVLNQVKDDNNFKIMLTSGSKGTPANLGQMIGCIGLQVSEGGLVKKKLNRRTLPYFHQDDDRSMARGMIVNSYYQGLSWTEFIFHIGGGRENMIDKAIKTAETGYLQRKLIKMGEDVMIKYDGTVRTANDHIVQLLFGYTGIDTTRCHEYEISLLKMSNNDIRDTLTFTKEELLNLKNFNAYDNTKLFHELREMRNNIRSSVQKFGMDYKLLHDKYMISINLNRIVNNYIEYGKNNKNNIIDDPKYILNKLEDALNPDNMSLISMSKKQMSDASSFKYIDDRISKTITKYSLYDALNPKKVINQYKLTYKQFDTMMDEIIKEHNKNVIDYGEMVGIIGAQANGEPLTQMNLDAIHSTGHGNISYLTSGVSRVKEIFSVTKSDKMKTPQMSVFLNKKYRNNRDIVNKIASHIKFTSISDIFKKIDVHNDPEPYKKGGFMETDNIGKPFYTSKSETLIGCQSDIENLPILIRIELFKDLMLEKGITLFEIQSKFCSWWEKRHSDIKSMKKEEKRILMKISAISILSSSENDDKIFIHIRFGIKDIDKKDKFNYSTLEAFIDNIISNFQLKGIKGVKKINEISPENINVFGNDRNSNEYDENDNEEIHKEEEYVIYTAGCNLEEIRYIFGVDLKRTISNDIVNVYETFGIEFARTLIIREIIYAYGRAGHEVHYHHVSVLVDLMTIEGFIMQIDRHGMAKSDQEPMSRASFERQPDQFLKAAVFSETDNLNGVSARIMMGMIIKGGTGYPDVMMNTDMIINSEMSENTKSIQNNIEGSGIINDVITSKSTKKMFIPNKKKKS
jgi:DNA-directed RNA polymerase II subunit RPB1